jgi:hypothetical protein
VVENNEFTRIIENGEHNDCLQTTWGGIGLVFRGNYLHDNRCQGLFIKDGTVSDVSVTNNLMLRNLAPSPVPDVGDPQIVQLFDVNGLFMANNTIWTEDSQVVLRNDPEQGQPTAMRIDHNVVRYFVPYDDLAGDAGLFADPRTLVEDYNVLGDGYTWIPELIGRHSVCVLQPDVCDYELIFRDALTDDYRLAGPVFGGGSSYSAGVNWRPADRQFGR